MRLPYDRSGVRTWLLLIGLLAGHVTPTWVARGVPFLLAAIALHLWSKGCLHQEKEVTTSGPYRLVRHPFYLANALMDTSIAIMSGWWPLLLALPFWWLAVYVPVMRREERIMSGIYGEAYAAYRAGVPMLLPWRWRTLRATAAGAGGFSWQNPNIAEVEVPRALRSLAYPLMFLIASRLHSPGSTVLVAPHRFDILLALGCLGLYTAAWGVKRQTCRHRRNARSACDTPGGSALVETPQ